VAAANRIAELSRHFVDVVPVDVFAWYASNPVPEPPQIENAAIHQLSRQQPESRDVLPHNRSKEARPFVARGDRGYLATLDGRFAGWLWLSRVSHRDPWSGLRLRIAPDEAYLYALWAEPDYRKLGVGALLMSAVLSDMQREPEVNCVYGWVDSGNREMQVLIRMAFGFTQVQRVRRARLLHLIGWQVPWSDAPRFGPVSRAGRHSTRHLAQRAVDGRNWT
jgi:ribosomal protein S18 acetylase RimI-like enzyme